jgi:hypothetical protein
MAARFPNSGLAGEGEQIAVDDEESTMALMFYD